MKRFFGLHFIACVWMLVFGAAAEKKIAKEEKIT